MQKAAETNRFLIGLSLGRELADLESLTGRESLLQNLVASALARAANSRELFDHLYDRLVQLAQHAYSLRDVATLEEVSKMLVNFPVPTYLHIGQYYRALAIRQTGKIEEAVLLLEPIADNAPALCRARAIQTLGAIHHRQGRVDEALRFYSEALRLSSNENRPDLLTNLFVRSEISCIRSERGDHCGAFCDLERLAPLVSIVSRQNPLYFYVYHNELAVELGELGRLAEAEAACAIALASPFAHAYPEWSETRQELEAKRTSATRSIVAVNRAPEAKPKPQIEAQHQPESAPQIVAQPQPKQLRVCRLICRATPADNKASFQRSVIPFPAKTPIAFIAVSILDRMLDSIVVRGPPASRRGTFRQPSKSIVGSTKEQASGEQNQFASRGFCAQTQCVTVAISPGTSSSRRSYTSRAPPQLGDSESEAGSPCRPTTTPKPNYSQTYGNQHIQHGLVSNPEVTPQSQFGRFQESWTDHGLTRPVHLNRTRFVCKEPTHELARLRAGGYPWLQQTRILAT
jgi:tetratricopeptide (TPR) repeat protein